MTYSVLMDVDTGIDDALAITFAVKHPEIDVRGISCVAGNGSLESVVANTLRILDVADAPDIPVAAGAVRPLIEPAGRASTFHGTDGLADVGLPASDRRPEPIHAVDFLRDRLLSADEPQTLIALAPLTNIALLLRTYPEVTDKIERIVFMGGSATWGNVSAVAEFNIRQDPEAAHIVLGSGVPLTMYGLDVFEKISLDLATIDALRRSDRALERTLGELVGFQREGTDGSLEVYRLIGDAGAVCALVAPELFTWEKWPVQVELAPGLSRGQTLVDRRERSLAAFGDLDAEPWPEIEVAMDVSAAEVARFYLDTVLARPFG